MRVMIAFMLVMLVGCNAQNETFDKGKRDLIEVKDSTIENVDRKTGQEVSRHLVELATEVPKVKDATAVVIGKYALVGIDVSGNLERSDVGSIKYSVTEALKDDPHGARAIVVADPDLAARVKEIADDVKNGRPLSGIMNELSDISGRLMPEVPGHIIEPNPKDAPEKPKKNMNKNDQQKLEKEQDDQSKHYKD